MQPDMRGNGAASRLRKAESEGLPDRQCTACGGEVVQECASKVMHLSLDRSRTLLRRAF